MNLLAHLVFTDCPDTVLAAATLADTLKGLDHETLPSQIRDGWHLHQDLDTYAGKLLAPVRQAISPIVRKHSDAVVDIYFDHFLAKNWEVLFSTKFQDYVANVHAILREQRSVLPSMSHDLVDTMTEQNWLTSYQSPEGAQRALYRISERPNRPKRAYLIKRGIPLVVNTLPQYDTFMFENLPKMRQFMTARMVESGYSPKGRVVWKEGNMFVEGLVGRPKKEM